MVSKKQKVRNAVIFVAILVFVLGGVNYYVDSYALIRISYKEIASQMEEGKNIVGLTESRGNERYLAYAVIEGMEDPLECIVLGSSRSMVYGKEHFDMDGSFYNFSLSGGTLEDYYGILGYLEYKDMLPKKIVMEIGGPLFNADDIANRHEVLQSGIDYLECIIRGEEAVCITPKVGKQPQKLFALDYFKYNLQCLFQGARFEVEYTNTPIQEKMTTKMSDGSIDYSKETNARDAASVDAMIEEAIVTGNIYNVKGYTQMSAEKQESFEALIGFLMGRGVEVDFFLPPYAEEIYTFMANSNGAYDGVIHTEEYIVRFAEEKDIELYGSFSPNDCELKSEDLLDAFHMRREGAEKAFYLR